MKITNNDKCEILIYDDSEYPINGLSYEKSVSLYLIWLNNSDKSNLIYNKISNHNGKSNLIKISELEGGYLTVCHIVIPTVRRSLDDILPQEDEEYVRRRDFITDVLIDELTDENESLIEIDLEDLNIFTNEQSSTYNPNAELYYFFENGLLFKENSSGEIENVEYSELLEVNPESCNFLKETYNFFSICQLKKCYKALCYKIFNDRAFDKCFNEKVDSQLIYRRDLVWAALNVILYMIELNRLPEALRLLERISGCNGLCQGINVDNTNCGCS